MSFSAARDIRTTALFRESEALFKAARAPGTGQISDAAEISVAPAGGQAVFAGSFMDSLETGTASRICLTDLADGNTRVLTFGPNTDRTPKFSPEGTHIAFLSDRHKAGDFQLHLLDPATGTAHATPRVEGWVEYLHWSPDGERILLGVAGHGADLSGGQGAVTSKPAAGEAPAWMPSVATGDESYRWRTAWVYELATNTVRKVTPTGINTWELAWCGNQALAAVVSPSPGEGLWYSADLERIELAGGERRTLFTPQDQLGWPAASPSGKQVAIVEALCSDRWVVAGDLRLIDTVSGDIKPVATNGVDISYTEWRSDNILLLAGHRGFETVVALYDTTAGTFKETWRSQQVTTSGFHASVSGFGATGDCVLVGESFTLAPEIGTIRAGQYARVKSFDLAYAEQSQVIGAVEATSWQAPDGLEIQGWLLTPRSGRAPYPLVTVVHGGPVGQHRPRWLGRAGVFMLMLLRRGYAIFLPNPRGSSGRGQAFARKVYGELGGAETQDHLSGLDALVERGIADPKRLGVTGVSHGGYMSSWIITQDTRFAAAIPVSPVTNFVTEHLISNIPHFVSLFLADSYTNPTGKYFARSPVMHAHKVKTPTLNICGALDRCTPPEEALQFHSALLENGVTSVLLTYPEEGHGIRKLPAGIDYAARAVEWFELYMGA